MTLEGLGEVFKGDSADTWAGKSPLVSMGGRANGQACADGERGPPSARAEILSVFWADIPLIESNPCFEGNFIAKLVLKTNRPTDQHA